MRLGRIATVLTMVFGVAALTAATPRAADARDQDELAPRRGPTRGRERRDFVPWRKFLPLCAANCLARSPVWRSNTRTRRWRYEFRVVDGQGRLFEVYVNARSGEIERIKEK